MVWANGGLATTTGRPVEQGAMDNRAQLVPFDMRKCLMACHVRAVRVERVCLSSSYHVLKQLSACAL